MMSGKWSAPLATAACLLFAVADGAGAAGYEVVRAFVRAGTQPLAPLTAGADGSFYGTTVTGGAAGGGTVFRVSATGELTTLAALDATTGMAPEAPLVAAGGGTFLGTGTTGGAGGFGTVFQVSPAGDVTVLAHFTGTAGAVKGAVPGGLLAHTDGNIYGVTAAGGAGGAGTVFKMTPAGAVTTLVEFTGTAGAAKGAEPVGPLVASGVNLYGVTKRGGAADSGVIYRVTPAGAVTTLAEFTGTAGARPGASPAGPLLLHSDGALYGTTEFGGAEDFGTAFKVTTAGAFTSLHAFADASGSQPAGTLVQGADGALRGVTSGGGADGWGTLFRLTTAGAHTVLAAFTGESGDTPGASPRGGLTARGDGSWLGTTSAGGPGNMGTVFTASAAGVVATLATLSLPTGWTPSGAPVGDGEGNFLLPLAEGGTGGGGVLARVTPTGALDAAAALGATLGEVPTGAVLRAGGDFFAVTALGGTSGRGTAYRFSPATGGVETVAPFQTSAGSLADGPLIAGSDGALYGVGREGGAAGRGTMYRLTTTGSRSRVVSFTGTGGAARGARPRGPLALVGVNFYGMTEAGGTSDAGTIFRVTPAGSHSVIADFAAAGPRAPREGLILGSDGKLYGATSLGGAADLGTLVRVDPAAGSWSVVAEFTPATGGEPAGPLLAAPDGSLLGCTTAGGASGFGGVFRWSAVAGLEALVSFTGQSGAAPGAAQYDPGDGEVLTGGLSLAADGTVWGTAPAGGAGGGGVLFRLSEPSPLADWKQSELGDATAPDDGDPDADGLPTLVEYGLVSRPGVPDAVSALASSRKNYPDGERLSLLLARDPARSDVTVTVEAAHSLLGPWEPVATSDHGAPFTGDGYVSGDFPAPTGVRTVEIRDPVPLFTAPSRFLRVRVSR